MATEFSKAKQMLPKWARGLAPFAVTVTALRHSVIVELENYAVGDNPLERKQVEALQAWLVKTQ